MGDIGKAYVQIIPKAEGISNKIETLLGGGSEAAGQSAGGKWSAAFGAVATTGLAVVGAGMAAATAGIVSFGKSAVEAGSQFESAFAQLRTIMDDTQMSEAAMSEGIMAMSAEFGVAASELSVTAYNAISATGDTAGALDLVENATKLAAAGFTDTGSALSTLTTAMNAYGISADESMGIADSLIEVQNLGVTTVSELAASMGKGIATASAYGVDLANLETGYISLTKNGIATAEATTYMSSMFKELGDSGSDVSAVLQTVTGKTFSELLDSGYSVADVLGVLSDSVNGDSTALMNLWGSAEAGKAANAIASQGLDTFNANLEEVRNSAGLTETAFSTMSETTEFKLARLSTGWDNLKVAVSEGILPDLGEWADFGTEALAAITAAFKTDGVQGAMKTLGTYLSDGISMVTGMLPEMTAAGMELLGALGQGLLDNLPMMTDAAVEITLQLAEGLLDALPEMTSAALDIIIALADGLTEALPELIPAITEAVTKITETLIEHAPELLGAGLQLILALAEGLITSRTELAAKAPEIIGGLFEALVNAFWKLDDFGTELHGKLGELATGTDWAGIGSDIMTAIWDGLKAVAVSLDEWWTKKMETWGEKLYELLHPTGGGGGHSFGEPGGGAGASFGDPEGAQSAAAAFNEAYEGALLTTTPSMGPWASQVSTNAGAALMANQAAQTAAQDAGDAVAGAMAEGIEAGGAQAVQAVEALAPELAGASQALMDGVMPGGAVDLLAAGIEESGAAAVEAVGAMGEDMASAADTALEGLGEAVSAANEQIQDAASGLGDALSEAAAASLVELGPALAEAATAGMADAVQASASAALGAGLTAAAAQAQADAAAAFTEAGTQSANTMAQAVDAAAPSLAAHGAPLVSSLWAGVLGAMPMLSGFAGEVLATVSGGFAATYSSFVYIGAQIVEGVRQGFSSNFGALRATVVSLVQGLVAEVRAELQISSPSRVFAQIGGFMAQGLGQGMERGGAAINSAARRMARNAVRAARRAAGEAARTVTNEAQAEITVTASLVPIMDSLTETPVPALETALELEPDMTMLDGLTMPVFETAAEILPDMTMLDGLTLPVWETTAVIVPDMTMLDGLTMPAFETAAEILPDMTMLDGLTLPAWETTAVIVPVLDTSGLPELSVLADAPVPVVTAEQDAGTVTAVMDAAAYRPAESTGQSRAQAQPASVTYNITIESATSAEIDYLLDQIDARGGERI